MRILLIGAYGFIGSAIAQKLTTDGHDVIGLGRSLTMGQRVLPMIAWRQGDLNQMGTVGDWLPLIAGMDAVINASGALQSGGGDRLNNIQSSAMRAAIEACEGALVPRFIQISVPGAVSGDSSPFLATKGEADDRLRRSSLGWAILRPGLVIGRNAYGGTMLLRALAALPAAQLTVYGDRQVQSVALDDVVDAVRSCLTAPADGMGKDIDLVEREPKRLTDVVAAHRVWLGLPPARVRIDLPPILSRPLTLLADILGHLGWRSPLRSTAIEMIARNVTGEPQEGEILLGRPLSTLDESLALHPSGAQDRWQARLFLLLPFMVSALAILFLLSGAVSLIRLDTAARELTQARLGPGVAKMLVISGAVADIALAVALLWRRSACRAAIGMAGLSLAYLLLGSVLRPDYWSDPLAPLAKILPIIVLALVASITLEER